MIYRQDTPI